MVLRRSPSSTFSALFGTATLVAGTVAGIQAGCPTDLDLCTILLSRNTPGGTPGFLTATAATRNPSVSTFSIDSTSGTDTSTVNWIAIPKNVGLGASTTFVNNASLRRPPSGLFVRRGTTAAMVGGSTLVTTQPFTANAKIFVMANTRAGTAGHLSAPDANVLPASGSFVINSTSNTDTSTVDWIIIDEYPRFSPNGRRFAQSRGSLNSASGNFTDMNPLQEEVSVIASFYGTSNPGFLAAPSGSRLAGAINVTSSNTSDGGGIELAAF